MVCTDVSVNQAITFPLTDVPTGSGRTVTVPPKASSKTLADMVVLIGTPSLLKKKSMRIAKQWRKNELHQMKLKIVYLNKAANTVLTVPRFDKSISISIPSASRAW